MEELGLTGLKRIILFVHDVAAVRAFYVDRLGLQPLPGEDAGWVELAAGSCILALHKAGTPGSGAHSPAKICFHSSDIEASREKLVARGVKMGKVIAFGDLRFCDGADPEGNPFQISNR